MAPTFEEIAICQRAQELYRAKNPGHVDGETTIDVSALCDSLFKAVDERYVPPEVALLEAKAKPKQWGGGVEVTGDDALAWLRAAHGVGPGDVILLEGWAKPREVFVESLSLSKSSGEDNYWWMSFDGPCKTPKGAVRALSGTFARSRVYKQDRPSPSLSRFLAEETSAS